MSSATRKSSSPTKENVEPLRGTQVSKLRRSFGEKGNDGKEIFSTITTTSSTSPKQTKYLNRTQEAKACLQKAKLHLNNSRNLKTEIKNEVLAAINRLYELVKEAEVGKTKCVTEIEKDKKQANEKEYRHEEYSQEIREVLAKNTKLMIECNEKMGTLQETLERHGEKLEVTTYASVAASHTRRNLPEQTTLHSVIVTSRNEIDTGEKVIDRIREAIQAKDGGVRIDKIRKMKDCKIIIGSSTKEEKEKVKEKLKTSSELQIEEVKNKNPLLILRDVLDLNSDDDVQKGVKNQNIGLFKELTEEEQKIEIKYRIKTRNPHVRHVVLRVSPQFWQRATAAQAVHIDLQRVRVEDHSPLIQCSVCLGYGHTRRFCTETVEKCSHCGGPHMRTACEYWKNGSEPTCCNCLHAKLDDSSHSAFSKECAIRKKWDMLARATVAYC